MYQPEYNKLDRSLHGGKLILISIQGNMDIMTI